MTKIKHVSCRQSRPSWRWASDRCFGCIVRNAFPRQGATSGKVRLRRHAASTFVGGFALLCGTGFDVAAGQAAAADRPPPASDSAVEFSAERGATARFALGPDVYGLEVGDRVLISVYGREDLSKEYRINDRGQIRIPSLGAFDAKALTSTRLEDKIQNALERSTQRSAHVTVDIVERRPIFVTGHVARPGSYRFSPGMTVIHATAIAGGMGGTALAASLPIQALRENSSIRTAQEEMKHLIARRARLLADRKGDTNIAIPPRLVDLVGTQPAAALIKKEQEILDRERVVLASQEAALKSAVEQGKIEVSAIEEEQLKVAEQRRLRESMVAGLEELRKKRLATSQRMTDVLMLLASVDRDAQNMIASKARARQTLKTAERDLALLSLERKNQIDRDLQNVDEQLSRLGATIHGARKIVERITGMPSVSLLEEREDEFRFEVLRKNAKGEFGTILASETTPLRPGDVLRISAIRAGGVRSN